MCRERTVTPSRRPRSNAATMPVAHLRDHRQRLEVVAVAVAQRHEPEIERLDAEAGPVLDDVGEMHPRVMLDDELSDRLAAERLEIPHALRHQRQRVRLAP